MQNATAPGSSSRLFASTEEALPRLDCVSVRVREHFAPGDAAKHMPLGLTVSIALEGSLTAEQRARLLRAAEKCPVKRIISGDLKEGIQTVELKT